MLMHQNQRTLSLNRRRVLILAFIAVALYVIVPQIGGFSNSWQHLRKPDFTMLSIAMALTLGTFVCAALTYCLLAFRRLSYRQTLLVQFAAMFVNRLLPAGIGAAGVGFTYLRGQRHTAPQATAVVAVNNILGFTGHLVLILAVLLVSRQRVEFSQTKAWLVLLVVAVVVSVVLICLYSFGGRRMRRFMTRLRRDFSSFRKRLHRVAAAQLSSIGLTLANILSLYYCAGALGVQLSLIAVILIFTFGVGLATATPTPGGLGGFEAGLVAGFTAYNVEASLALAIALLYRLISYWFTLVLGGLAFIVVGRRKLLKV